MYSREPNSRDPTAGTAETQEMCVNYTKVTVTTIYMRALSLDIPACLSAVTRTTTTDLVAQIAMFSHPSRDEVHD